MASPPPGSAEEAKGLILMAEKQRVHALSELTATAIRPAGIER